MALYRLKDSPYWWVTIVNPRTNQRIRKSTKLTDKLKAKLFEEQLMASLVLGEQHYALEAKLASPTWQQAAERWLTETQHKKDHVNDKVKVVWLRPHLGSKELKNVTANVIYKIAEIKARETSQVNANRTLALIRAVLNRAHKDWDWLGKVPHIRLYKENPNRIRYLTKEEAKGLLSHLPLHLREMAIFSLQTGLRASNVTGLKWAQVDLERNHLWIHGDEAKAGKAIPVPLSPLAREVIVRQMGKHEKSVFTFRGNPVTRPSNHAWFKALERAGLMDFRWHDLRHTWATWHIQAGTPLHVLQELGGWSSFEMVRRYAHLTSKHLQEFASQISLDVEL